MDETITVAGATGYGGRHIVAALDERGLRVRARTRRTRPAGTHARSVSRRTNTSASGNWI